MSRRRGTDAELVSRAGHGDLEAFDRLVMRHRSRLYGIARQVTGDAEAAQDVVQEGLVRAFRSLGALRDSDRLGQWLNTIVRRESTRWLRDGKRRPEPRELGVFYGGASVMSSAGGRAPDEVVALIREGLKALKERERRVMVLHYLEGFTCDEVAAKLGISVGGVRNVCLPG